jgi:hypothetical protein
MAEDWLRDWAIAVTGAEEERRQAELHGSTWPAYGVVVGWATVLAVYSALVEAEEGWGRDRAEVERLTADVVRLHAQLTAETSRAITAENEVTRLRAALERYADRNKWSHDRSYFYKWDEGAAWEIAEAALGGKDARP